MYEDLGLITTDERIGEDVAHLFNNLSGWSRNASYEELLVAPDSVRTGLIDQIHQEIQHHRAGRPARIRMKANSVVDEARDRRALPRLAGRASRSSCWCAGSARCGPACPACRRRSRSARSSAGSSSTAGCSGSRTAATPDAWIGSADMMHRNLDRRVEVLVRLPGEENVAAIARLLDLAFDADTSAWLLGSDGEWRRNDGVVHLQEALIESQRKRRTTS